MKTFADFADFNVKMIRDRSTIIAAVSEELYDIVREEYFSFLDSNGHYAFYDLVVELVDEVMFSHDSAYMKAMMLTKADPTNDFSDYFEELTNECFDWYHMGLAIKLAKEKLKEWRSTEAEIRQSKIKAIIDKLKLMEVNGQEMQYIIENVGMEDQMLKQLMVFASDFDINNNLELREEVAREKNLKSDWREIRNQRMAELALAEKAAKKTWDDLTNNDTLTFGSFQEYWNYIKKNF